MPPKKAGKAKAPPAKAAVDVPSDEVPSSVTSKRGTEYQTTAAAGRPRRATMVPTIEEFPAPKSHGNARATPVPAPKKRGRPAKEADDDVEEGALPKKKAGRPPKAKAATTTAASPKRGRGRPKKTVDDAVPGEEKGPPFTRHEAPFGGETTVVEKDDEAAADQLEEELLEDAGATRKRKAPAAKKGKAKSKGAKKALVGNVEEDEDDEGLNAADASAEPADKSFWLLKAEQEDRFETAKSGQVNNTKFTIDDLRSKTVPEPWDGVRNAVAAKNMRAMSKGDLAFFYASGGKTGRKPGITGIMEIVAEASPDETVHDENAYGYVEKKSDREKWVVVHVEFRKKLSKPVLLSELQKYSGTGKLANMQVLKTARLSVTKVSRQEWNFICDDLIEGYEDEDEKTGAAVDEKMQDAKPSGMDPTAVDSDIGMTDDEPGLPSDPVFTNGNPDIIMETVESEPATTDTVLPTVTAATSSRPASRAPSRRSSKAPSVAPEPVIIQAPGRVGSRRSSRVPSVAPETASVDISNGTVAKTTSRAPSRRSSRAPSVGPSTNGVTDSRPGSAGGLAPPRAGRGRSRTPQPIPMTTMAEEPGPSLMESVAE